MRLVVNADDFGLTPGVNRGIIEAHQKGIVTSATLMANAPAFDEAVSLVRQNPGLGVGCHLVTIGGKPVLDASAVRLLVGASGQFPQSLQEFLFFHPGCLSSGWRGQEQLAQEFAAQVEKIRQAGLRISHLDTHKHLHALPGVREAVFQVARQEAIAFVRFPFESGLGVLSPRSAEKRKPLALWRRRAAVSAMRWLWAGDFRDRLAANSLKSADATFGIVHTGRLTRLVIEAFLRQQHKVIEICCHPGYDDSQSALPGETLHRRREDEVAILTDPGWKALLAARGVRLTNYVELARA